MVEYVKAGKLHALAVTGAERVDALPDVPTMAEFLPGFEASVWHGIGAPKNTSMQIVQKLNKEINGALADPKLQERFAALGGTRIGGSPGDFGNLIGREIEKWGKVVRTANIKTE